MGIDMLQVRTFLNYDEAYIYMHRLLNNADMAHKLSGLKLFIISEDNLRKLIKDDEPSSLDEPTELPEPSEGDDGQDDVIEEDNYIF